MASGTTYRRLAHDCLQLSVRASTASERARLVDMAQGWMRLANSAPALEQMIEGALVEAADAGPSPLMIDARRSAGGLRC
jgi:hypothetical protein